MAIHFSFTHNPLERSFGTFSLQYPTPRAYVTSVVPPQGFCFEHQTRSQLLDFPDDICSERGAPASCVGSSELSSPLAKR
jgi:hypothetical protein